MDPRLLPATVSTPDGIGWTPPARMPSGPAVSYWRDALGLLLLIVALPWLLYHLLTNPARVLASRGPNVAA